MAAFRLGYIYRGDKFTRPDLRGAKCFAVTNRNRDCVRGRNGNMLVTFDGRPVVVLGRQLRRVPATWDHNLGWIAPSRP